MLDIYKIIKNTTVEGPGTRFCIWTQGCNKHCEGCFAKDTWEFDIGQKYSVDELLSLIKSEKNIEGVTFLGGEPFEQAEELSILAKNLQLIGLSVVCFTGYTIEELHSKSDKYTEELLANIDLLIDGGFVQEKFDLSRAWVGSSNQRYLYLTNRYSPQEISKYKNKIEARIGIDGKLEVNGMGDFRQIEKSFCLQLGKNNVK